MESKLTIFEKFAYSLYNFKAYKYFIKEKFLKSLLYILIVNIVFSFFVSIKLASSLNMVSTEFKNVLNSDVPNFYIKDGSFHVDSDEPFIYKDISANLTFVLDNSPQSQNTLSKYDNVLLVNNDKLTLKIANTKIQEISFKESPDITKDDFCSLIDLEISFFIICIFFIVPILFIFWHLFSAFIILGPSVYLLGKSINLDITYKEASLVAVYSLSFPIILTSLLFLIEQLFSGFFILYYALAFIYCNMAMNSIKESKNTHINNTI